MLIEALWQRPTVGGGGGVRVGGRLCPYTWLIGYTHQTALSSVYWKPRAFVFSYRFSKAPNPLCSCAGYIRVTRFVSIVSALTLRLRELSSRTLLRISQNRWNESIDSTKFADCSGYCLRSNGPSTCYIYALRGVGYRRFCVRGGGLDWMRTHAQFIQTYSLRNN